jgi:fructose-1,6-bisphosphatase/inositol monophosphatase family enzyme
VDRESFTFDLESVGYADVMVANGEFGAVIFSGEHPWDSAAPKIIVEEAGGKLTDLYGGDLNFRGKTKGHLASNGILHQELIDLVSPYLPPRQ